jgi:hypothetical protein
MGTSDWLAIAALGAGALMGTLGKRTVRAIGIVLVVLGIGGLAYSHFYQNADAQPTAPSISNNGSGNNTVVVPGNNNTINNNFNSAPGVGRVAHFQFAERQITSSNPDLPFELQITILSDQVIEKPAFIVTCTGPISEGQAGVGAGVYTITQNLISDDKLSFGFRWSSPDFTPETPLTVTLFSKSEIHCPELKDARLITFVIH